MKPARIAFFSQGASNWVAGTIYIHNLVRALHLLPTGERPELHMILGPAQDGKADAELGRLRPRTHYYCFRASNSRDEKLRIALQSLRQGRWPCSLEKLTASLEPAVIFPVQGWSLGKDFPVPWIGWIPDFQHQHLPQFFTETERRDRDRTYAQLIRECRHMVVSSEEARKDLLRWYEADPGKVTVFPFRSVATDQWFAGDPAATVAEYKLPAKYLMFPSQFWVHKNHMTVLKALARLKREGLGRVDLVCTGFTQDYRRPEHFPMVQAYIKENGLEGNVHILGLLPRAKQIHLMRAAAAIMQPSLFEGWSSLVEDARTLGKPVFLSDIPIHREQDPPDATYFSAEDDKQLAELIAQAWPHLQPGVDKAREHKAQQAQIPQAQSFARSFLSIVKKLGATHRIPN